MRNLKRVLSLALALVMVLGMMVMSTSAATFTDDAEVEYKEAIEVMAGIGLFEGNDDGTVAPKQVLNRAMAATILTRIKLGDKADNLIATKQIFSDVKVTDWYAEEVEYCYNAGLIAGNGDGTFNPEGELTGIAFAKLLLVALGYDADEQGYVGPDWSTNIAVDALTAGLYIKNVDIAGKLTREQAAQMILQLLDVDEDDTNMVQYVNSFDKDTGKATVIGPLDETNAEKDTFREAYYPLLTRTGKGNETTWGRPYTKQWAYDGEAFWTKWEDAKAVYYGPVSECQIATDVKMKGASYKYDTFINGYQNYVDDGQVVVATNVNSFVGKQGQLIEVYSDDIVVIDTFLAKVDKVADATYDKAGHLATPSALYLTVYDRDGGIKLVENNGKDNYTYKAGQYLLVNAVTWNHGETVDLKAAAGIDGYAKAKVLKITGEAASVAGPQTWIWTNADKHTVNGTTYNDANQYHLDDAGMTANVPFTWFFDSYGNVIGSASITTIPVYATIANIQWYNPAFTNGYALATLVYTDGSTEQVVVDKIDNLPLSYTLFTGNPATGAVSMNYASNNLYIGEELYVVAKNAAGIATLTAVDTYLTGADVIKGNPVVNTTAGVYIDNSTQFLVRTGNVKTGYTWTPVVGFTQISTIENATVYYINKDSNPYVTEIVYMFGDAPGASGAGQLVYIAGPGYKTAAGDDKYITLTEAQVKGVTTDVKVGNTFAMELNELYYMYDGNGDGDYRYADGDGDSVVKVTESAMSVGGKLVAKKVAAANYAQQVDALWVTGDNTYYNVQNVTVYGTWVPTADIVLVYEVIASGYAVVSAIYVL